MKTTRARKVSQVAASAAIAGLVLVGCGKKDKEDEATATTTNDGGAKLTEVKSIDQLNVAGSLKVTLPSALSQTKTKLMELRTVGNKSQDACRVGSTIKELVDDLASVSNFFCHLEVEKEKIKFGKKYKVSSGGQEFARIWADNSAAAEGKITLYMFQDGKLKEKIAITGVNPDAKTAKGTMQNLGSQGNHSWGSSITFDIGYTTAGLKTISAEQSYSDSAQGGSFARKVALSLYETATAGISKASMASKGTWGGSAFADRALGLFDGTYGSTLFYSKGTYSNQSFDWKSRDWFDSNGKQVANDGSAKFASGQSLYVNAADLPEYLADNFSIAAPTGWDGSFDEEITLDPDSAAHKACEKDRDQHEECWGAGFEDGTHE